MKKVTNDFQQMELFTTEEITKADESIKEFYRNIYGATPYIQPMAPAIAQTAEEEEREIFGETTIFENKGKLQSDLNTFDKSYLLELELKEKKEKEQKEAEEKKKQADELKNKILEARKKIKNLPYFTDPKNDNERLFNFQYEYIHNGNNEAWGELIQLAFIVCKRLVRRCMKDELLYIDEVEQDEKASIAMEYVLRRFQNTPGYYCNTNFITFLSDGVTHAIKYRTKENENLQVEDFKEEIHFQRIGGNR